MADIRKTFNFRDGVQVDDEVLVVRGNRVGVGTTSPDQKLDVRGNVNITGITSTVNFNVTGVGTFNSVSLGSTINLDATSGVITASSFKGDGSTLSNLPTSQWTDVGVGTVTPIYVEGNVGVGTTNPVNAFQVGGDPNNGIGVGFSTSGNIKASGIITATSVFGNLFGNVTGNVVGDVTGTASTATLANTATLAVNAQGLTGSPNIAVGNITASGTLTSGDITSGNIQSSGIGTIPTLDTTNIEVETVKGFSSLRSPHSPTATSITVTVAAKTTAHRYHGTGSGNAFVLDGVQAPFLTLTPGRNYKFDQSDGTNVGHGLRFYYDVDKTTPYTTGVSVSGVSGQAGSFVQLNVTDTTPTVLHYQCNAHAKMGNSVQTNSNVLDTEHDSTVRGNLTATTFSGNLTGNVTGNLTGSITGDTTVSGASTFTGNIDANGDLDVDGHTNLDNVSISGVTTFAGNTNHDGGATVDVHLDVIGLTTLDDVRVSSGATFEGAIDANGDLDVDGMTNLDDVNVSGVGTITHAIATSLIVSGVSTFSGSLDANGNATIAGTLDVDGSTTLDDLTVSAGATFTRLTTTDINQTGVTTSSGGFVGNLTGNVVGNVTGNASGTSSGLIGTPSVVITNLKSSGISTLGVTTALSLGIGTDNANADIQIHKESASSSIVIGKNSSVTDNNLQIRYGGGASAFSGSEALDIINHGDGNFNYFIANSGIGSFVWLKGNTNPLMALSSTGNLGIGVTNPSQRLVVSGNTFTTGISTVDGNLTVTGQITVPILNISDISANLVGNINSTGISTFNFINVKGSPNSGVGIGTTASGQGLTVGQNDPSQRVFVGFGTNLGAVGVRTDRLSATSNAGGYYSLEVRGDVYFHGGGLKVGGQPYTSATGQRAAVDFSDAVDTTDASTSEAAGAYMIPPRVTTGQRNNLRDGVSGSATLRTGAMIYNTTLNKLQVWTGSDWETITSSV